MHYEQYDNEVHYVKSDIDNNEYLVRKMPDSKQASNLMALIRGKLEKLCEYCSKKYPGNQDIKRMIRNFNPNNITETGKNSKYTSYSVNKGEKIVLCLRSKDGKDKLTDENTLTFVAIHELAHLMTKSIGHTDEFWKNFRFLLEQSIKLNIYSKVDYSKYPQPYCGIKVTDSPLEN